MEPVNVVVGLQTEIDRAKARGAQVINSFEGQVRPLDLNNFQSGDTFTLPESYEGNIYKEKVGSGFAQYIFVEVTDAEGNKTGIKRFYPSCMSKAIQECKSVDDPTPLAPAKFVKASGTATAEYQQHGDMNSGMNALAGKTLRISNITPVVGRRPVVHTGYVTNVYTVDIVK